MIFAPNHKGLPIFGKDEAPSYAYRQIITSRNIRPHFITDFFYGGLNYQIEHHLFPVMPRARLKKVRELVKEFCSQEGIPYQETSFLGSFREIYGHFVSGPVETTPTETP
jgi:fatty acid desaturase